YCDADGYVFITGRLKELIIKGGENIAPREIDDVLYSHKDVLEAGAFALPCPRYGQRVLAAVCLTAGSQATKADLLDLCRGELGAFKCPDDIYFMQELPKGPSGKIQRLKIAELVRGL
ncbi:MAG: AMP-dependent synthetase, partial [Proteobacteria bacterium]|nr:AMP-dependent synthetase [Pseudomonadota bacterium]